jgi:hypothetical protein
MPFMDEGLYTDIKRVCSEIEERSHKRERYSREEDGEGSGNCSKRSRVQGLVQTVTEEGDEDKDTSGAGGSVRAGAGSKCQDGYCVPCYELA